MEDNNNLLWIVAAGDRGPPHLQGLQIPLIDDGLCSSASSGWFDASNQICAWDQENVDAGMCTVSCDLICNLYETVIDFR